MHTLSPCVPAGLHIGEFIKRGIFGSYFLTSNYHYIFNLCIASPEKLPAMII